MIGSMPNLPYTQGAPMVYAMPQQMPQQMQPQMPQQMQPQMPQQMPQQMQPQTQPRYVVPPLAANDLKPKVRAQAPDPVPPPPRIVLPSPEALGIQVNAAAPKTAVDWNLVHARLEQLGVVNLRR